MLLLMHLYLERSLHSLGSNQGRQGFPQSCWCCAAKGWDVVGHFQAGDRSSGACCGLCQRQQGPILPAKCPHLCWLIPPTAVLRMCGQLPAASGAAWKLGSAEGGVTSAATPRNSSSNRMTLQMDK